MKKLTYSLVACLLTLGVLASSADAAARHHRGRYVTYHHHRGHWGQQNGARVFIRL